MLPHLFPVVQGMHRYLDHIESTRAQCLSDLTIALLSFRVTVMLITQAVQVNADARCEVVVSF